MKKLLPIAALVVIVALFAFSIWSAIQINILNKDLTNAYSLISQQYDCIDSLSADVSGAQDDIFTLQEKGKYYDEQIDRFLELWQYQLEINDSVLGIG